VLLRCLEEIEGVDYEEEEEALQELKEALEGFTQGFMAKGVEGE
jgi:predicted RNase H-like HicB family nuclease